MLEESWRKTGGKMEYSWKKTAGMLKERKLQKTAGMLKERKLQKTHEICSNAAGDLGENQG